MRTLLFAFIFVCVFASQAIGDDDSFGRMDTDGNNLVSWEEFHAAVPSMKRAAFDTIDTNRDGAISLDEWQAFRASHGNRKGMPMPHKAMPPADDTSDVPLIRPPKD